MTTIYPSFDVSKTLISQYANSPALLSIIGDLAAGVDGATLFNRFYDLIWNLDTAQGYGLDVWGRIVGVGRILRIPTDIDYFGFVESVDGVPFDEGIFYNNVETTQNYALSDTAYRRLILAKARSNIWDGSILQVNQILMTLFWEYGNCYVDDGLDMTMTYTFETRLSPVDYAIVTQSGVLPRPAGVLALVSMP